MRAVIMAGGEGLRLRPYTRILPKPMLPLGNRPILAWLLDRLVAAGVTEVTLAVRYMGYVFRSYFGDGKQVGVPVRYVEEAEPQGTAGPLRLIPDLDEPFLVVNADIVTGLDFRDFIAFHRSRGGWLTVATQLRRERLNLGVLEADGERVLAYHEKPERVARLGLGIYAVDPRALAYLPETGPVDMPEWIAGLLADRRPVMHYETEAPWFDLGSPEQYFAVMERWPELEGQMRASGKGRSGLEGQMRASEEGRSELEGQMQASGERRPELEGQMQASGQRLPGTEWRGSGE